ncbi:hypothetical protein NVP1072O_28 [Vibrio phage 1.072.O._10N.286.48.A12]|nr:hypothetical protein NVP1037O_27 [Vibrio phage 1.037.O._10N.261.52.F7]AUR84472.1 hypothetical protein NVP1056O_30 [Vibrio phage 1.056.O._10N.261.48.C11]AUR84989.1 hypothetical protein NVP1066O_30 [Vibrio phage 1.066.O._10N.286.46.E8]AUR85120.1 hypothetical protein NVP1068O_30 [Vibrio phage 1.068.O._10N.261.51.F8]AUR85345.1 hypothetical protein NVP1072O_28 [Vibrio phage 1.072.O._10N.286.48.A12]AUS01893.1 hypothetical protein NVP2044O_29 [Vibrio phage 2.044.O._10N.261.51.B8]
MTPEARASQQCRLFAGRHKCRLFRNNSGVLPDQHGTPVFFGLGNTPKKVAGKKVSEIRKSSDDIGYTIVTVTPEMVGHQLAVFTTIEYKAAGFKIKAVYPEKSREAKQLVWIDMAKKAGGIGGFACDKASLDAIFEEFYARFR